MRVLALPVTAVKAAIVGVVSTVLALALAFVGLLGHWSVTSEVRTVQARVVVAVPCDQSGQERVSYPGGEAALDACGHSVGDEVEVSLGTVVHLASANAGASLDARPIGVVLLIFAGMAGGGMAELLRRRTPPRQTAQTT
ncbi:hypothetical protein [Actinokineospora enzanensis]|uniref:hypothetical protein n=1 Tax=Actinokineospora enzanensis TaxID=155975 RepID=UPI000376CB17|nr:hypothetical protein [Actinokineospora enzanensis]